MWQPRKLTGLVVVLVLSLVLAACGVGGGDSATPLGDGTGTATEAVTGPAAESLYGHPWVTSILSDNLPPVRPAAKDDLYAHYCYDYLSSHQGNNTSMLDDYSYEMQSRTSSKTRPSPDTTSTSCASSMDRRPTAKPCERWDYLRCSRISIASTR